MSFLVVLIFENDDALKAMGLSTLNQRRTTATYQTDVTGGHEERDASYVKRSASMNLRGVKEMYRFQ